MSKKLPKKTKFEKILLNIDSDVLRQKLKLKHLEVKDTLTKKYPQVDVFFKEKGIDPGQIREHSAKLLGAGAIASALLLASPNQDMLKLLPSPQEVLHNLKLSNEKDGTRTLLVSTIKSFLPERPRPLVRSEEKFLEHIFINTTGIPVKASLEGEHLNTTYGYIGAEQHLRRFPGDSLKEHGEGQVLKSGIARGRGAWGYFAQSREQLTEDLIQKEKWYAVVQTLYLPDWNRRAQYLREWYKYRKVLIVNTENGKSVVAAIADSGPAAWTGKQFGGSPEVMEELGGAKYKKGPVMVFFVDDPANKIPLGPVDYSNVKMVNVLEN